VDIHDMNLMKTQEESDLHSRQKAEAAAAEAARQTEAARLAEAARKEAEAAEAARVAEADSVARAAKKAEGANQMWSTPQVFECLIPFPGVGYRFSPKFSDKNPDGKGPKGPNKYMIGSEFTKSENNVTFLKCSTGRGWLPLTNPAGSVQCFRHVGAVGEVDIHDMNLMKTQEESDLHSRQKAEAAAAESARQTEAARLAEADSVARGEQ